MTPKHQNSLGIELFLSQIKMFRLEMRRIRLSNLFHSVGAAKLRSFKESVGTISTVWWDN